MRTAAVAFVSSTLVGAVLTPVVRDLAHRSGLLDHGLSSRKVHGRPVPRLGGIAIVIAFFAPLAALFFVDSEVGRRLWEGRSFTLGLFGGGLGIALLGVYDDLKGANARVKFLVQFGVAAFAYGMGYRIDQLANPFGAPFELGWFGLPFTMLWIAGVVNAMNLIDGLDGLAGGVALIAIATLFVVAAVGDRPLMLLTTAALGGAVLGFLFYNFNPATIFMGDTGSMFLGFVLAAMSIRTNQKSQAAVAIAVPILALGVPIADTLLAMGRRAFRGAPMFSADRGHIHHRLLDRGLTHRQAVLVIYLGAGFLGAAALLLSFVSSAQAALVLLVVAILAFVALRALGFVDLTKAQAALVDRRRNLELRGAVRKAGEALRTAGSAREVWEILRDAAPAFGAAGVALYLGRLEGFPDAGPWSHGLDELPVGALRARYGLIAERPGDDHLELAWTDGRDTVHRDLEISVELLCDHASTALDRIEHAAPERASERVIRLKP